MSKKVGKYFQNIKRNNRFLSFIVVVFIISGNGIFLKSVQAAGLKKVAILDFINIENDEDFQYLESLITESVQKS